MNPEEKDSLYEALSEVAMRSANNIDNILDLEHLKNADEKLKIFIIEPQYDYW